jgi:hypothetical protein
VSHWSGFNPPGRCASAALPLRCHCAATALPLRCHCAATALPLRCHCAATALPLRWMKWGKTGIHLFPGGRYFVVLTPPQQPAPAAHHLPHQKIVSEKNSGIQTKLTPPPPPPLPSPLASSRPQLPPSTPLLLLLPQGESPQPSGGSGVCPSS